MNEPMSQEELKRWADERERVRASKEFHSPLSRDKATVQTEYQEISEALRGGQWKPDWQTVRHWLVP